jgi:hypothetical protein
MMRAALARPRWRRSEFRLDLRHRRVRDPSPAEDCKIVMVAVIV